MEKSYRMQIYLGVITLLALMIAFSSATYAWFTFSSDTNVEPLEGGIGYGEYDQILPGEGYKGQGRQQQLQIPGLEGIDHNGHGVDKQNAHHGGQGTV